MYFEKGEAGVTPILAKMVIPTKPIRASSSCSRFFFSAHDAPQNI
jgi:hypothetical protein